VAAQLQESHGPTTSGTPNVGSTLEHAAASGTVGGDVQREVRAPQ
jgi:hypothetical protein